ncbi:cytochrome c oxidase subunit 4 [Streptomyces sp. WMMB 322]|uniref:aa3-type cytochrome oxidase subunit IV n=1 Tax=Streptomyces sp. WMMB 322 TaxID=1286821 RepID=UPI0006E30559|nr:cytochrome c oxidase subunit 4 [Streptomyces sp. WMMB 322]SCK18872.1 Cytochrome c oxidase subunit IV [Streptomyces sp. WMMB 322]
MKVEALIFTGVAAFFAVVSACYIPFSEDAAGNTALLVSFLMSALIAVFLWVQYARNVGGPQGRKDADVHEGAGPLAFFSPRSYYPVFTALGTAVAGLGVIFGLWLFLIGIGITAPGVAGFVFQHNDR